MQADITLIAGLLSRERADDGKAVAWATALDQLHRCRVDGQAQPVAMLPFGFHPARDAPVTAAWPVISARRAATKFDPTDPFAAKMASRSAASCRAFWRARERHPTSGPSRSSVPRPRRLRPIDINAARQSENLKKSPGVKAPERPIDRLLPIGQDDAALHVSGQFTPIPDGQSIQTSIDLVAVWLNASLAKR